MVDKNILIIGGLAVVAGIAYFTNMLCKSPIPLGLCVNQASADIPAGRVPGAPAVSAAQQAQEQAMADAKIKAVGQGVHFPSNVGYAYAGYRSAPLSIA